MTKHNPENERIKRKYFAYLKEAKRLSEATVDAVAKSLSRFEEYTRYRDFKRFHYEQATAFKRHLAEQTGERSGEKLSKATLYATLKQLRAFFFWLAGQPGYKARLQYSDADYFNLSGKDTRIATAQREQKSPTLEQVRRVIETMPTGSETERRNRALVAFALMTGARDSAIASMKLKHVDMMENCVHQDPREVKTKFSKAITTYFLPIGDGVIEIMAEWVRFLREEKLWSNDDPLFPATRIALGATRQFEAAGLERKHWSTATPIRLIFREAFERAGLPYFHPHSLRKTLTRLGQQLCKSAEEMKAWSQNLGHEHVMTTLMSYGTVAADRQGEIIRGLATPERVPKSDADEIAAELFKRLRDAGVNVQTR
ncbi:MAG: site-specific integrase [Acidobacteriaceae bacterium]